MAITRVDVKLMKLHESLERMWSLFFAHCKNNPAVTDFIHEKKRCHELMSDISKEVNNPDA
jgi:hypothetical protein